MNQTTATLQEQHHKLLLALHKWIGWCTEWIVIAWWFKPHPTAMPCCCHWSAPEIHSPQPNKLAAADKLLLRRCPLRKKNKHVGCNQLTEPILLAHWTYDNIGGFRKLLTISARALRSWGSVSVCRFLGCTLAIARHNNIKKNALINSKTRPLKNTESKATRRSTKKKPPQLEWKRRREYKMNHGKTKSTNENNPTEPKKRRTWERQSETNSKAKQPSSDYQMMKDRLGFRVEFI